MLLVYVLLFVLKRPQGHVRRDFQRDEPGSLSMLFPL